MSSWAIAPRMPSTIVSPAAHSSSVTGRLPSGKNSVWVRSSA